MEIIWVLLSSVSAEAKLWGLVLHHDKTDQIRKTGDVFSMYQGGINCHGEVILDNFKGSSTQNHIHLPLTEGHHLVPMYKTAEIEWVQYWTKSQWALRLVM